MLAGLFFVGPVFLPASAHATTWDDHAELTAVANGNTANPVRIKASHITQMRNVVNDDLRNSVACGSLPDLTWRTLTGTPMEADDINTIKIEIDDPRYNVPQPLIDAINVTIGTPIRASDILKLRAAIDAASCGGGSVCGNGTVEAGEQCDDSNTNSGDGCSSPLCQCEYTWIDDVCAGGSPACLPTEMHETASDPDGAGACIASSRCVADATCSGCSACVGTYYFDIGTGCDSRAGTGCQVCDCENINTGLLCVQDMGGTMQPVEVCSNSGPTVYTCCGGATCSDNTQNGDETGIDCGGSVCPACPSTGNLVLGNAHFSGTPVWGDWRNLDTTIIYHVVTVGSPGQGLEVVPFGNYEWLGGDVVSEVGCPVPGDPPDIAPPIGTTQTIDAGTPDFGATVGCH